MPHPVSTSSTPPDPQSEERTATYGEVFASKEYRAVFAATVLSWVGDYLAKIAVTSLVFAQTGSAAAAAATFAISFAPWLLMGPVLTALADRLPKRTVMIVSDLARMMCIALVALPGLPIPVIIGLLFLTALGNPPYDASRSSLLATLLPGDKLVVGLSLQISFGQAAQLSGYLTGGVLAAINPRAAILIDSATFGLSAILLALFVKHRPATVAGERRNILRETGEGFSMVFGTPALRAITLLIFSGMLFGALPEGLGVVWADSLNPSSPAERGLYQGLIMLSPAVGFILGGLIVGRLVSPTRRRALIRPLAICAPATLIPSIFHPPLALVCAMGVGLGFCIAGVLPAANGLFVQALPNTHRARAFGVVQSGMQLIQGFSIIAAGWMAQPASKLPVVIGLWSIVGIIVMALTAVLLWPNKDGFATAIERARLINEAPAAG
ncbi:MFS transporter [Rhizocola hellebori]|uniref:MFS transporter n=1 Tax=Rhizocola hellebori TaxID=1392758 RepID=A0A8J3VJC7_9ACTN|nr:MFS transporter [Rhizocola hellebori]GIH09294.1 MFS transporter [Rhizocola hellebori]